MTNKKSARQAFVMSLVSLLLCCSMLMGTTFAWFTDTVTSTGNIIQSGTLDAELYYGDTADAINNDASEGAIFDYELWEPGYTQVKYVKIVNKGNLSFKYQLNVIPSMAVKEGEVNLAEVIDVYLFDATATVDRAAVAAATPVGTLADLMADADGAAYGYLLPAAEVATDDYTGEDPATGEVSYCIVLKMQEEAGNEYQNLSVGGGFAVQLLATQYTWENDSFDHTYDKDAEYDAAPKADVSVMPEEELENVSIPLYDYVSFSKTGEVQNGLDKGFVFKTTETEEEAAAGEYATWHADFVVTFDKPITTGTAGLAGQYDFWNMDWVGFEAFDIDSGDGVDGIPANTACRLLYGKGAYVDYVQLCRDIKVFNCGVFNNDEANNGTTITVELRLYETYTEEECEELFGYKSVNEETGNYITVGTYTYTFGK
ncbi:MAG: SipW-dependent-type signal peptide-containing protein [Oscillospiraceae bacterium]|nr:SipW-dependent-type signal peptide-containing protein [Oscillospiraceae bacterium]